MPHEVIFSRTSLKELRKIAIIEHAGIIEAIESLAENPRPDGRKVDTVELKYIKKASLSLKERLF